MQCIAFYVVCIVCMRVAPHATKRCDLLIVLLCCCCYHSCCSRLSRCVYSPHLWCVCWYAGHGWRLCEACQPRRWQLWPCAHGHKPGLVRGQAPTTCLHTVQVGAVAKTSKMLMYPQLHTTLPGPKPQALSDASGGRRVGVVLLLLLLHCLLCLLANIHLFCSTSTFALSQLPYSHTSSLAHPQ